jgi:hypothetical protein
MRIDENEVLHDPHVPPRRGFKRDMTPDPTAKNAFSNQLSGTWPGYAGSGRFGISVAHVPSAREGTRKDRGLATWMQCREKFMTVLVARRIQVTA